MQLHGGRGAAVDTILIILQGYLVPLIIRYILCTPLDITCMYVCNVLYDILMYVM